MDGLSATVRPTTPPLQQHHPTPFPPPPTLPLVRLPEHAGHGVPVVPGPDDVGVGDEEGQAADTQASVHCAREEVEWLAKTRGGRRREGKRRETR